MSVGSLSKEAVYTFLIVASPVLFIALVIGLFISLLQAVTQIQEATVSFVPKLLAVFLSLVFLAPWMLNKMRAFADHVLQFILS